MKRGKFHRVTTLVVFGLLVSVLAGFEGCGGIVGGSSGNSSITGTVFDAGTSAKLPIAGALVVLEQDDGTGTGTDSVVLSTTTAADGTFVFNRPAAGTYDVVVDASVTASGLTATYAATVTFGVPASAALGQIPLVYEFGSTTPNGNPVPISGTVSSSGASAVPSKVDVTLSTLLSVIPQVGQVKFLTIPTFAQSTTSITTIPAGPTCAINIACATYSLLVPAGNYSSATFSASGTVYNLSQQQPPDVTYTVEAKAFAHGSGLTPTCTPSNASSAIGINSGTIASGNPNLTFTMCP